MSPSFPLVSLFTSIHLPHSAPLLSLSVGWGKCCLSVLHLLLPPPFCPVLSLCFSSPSLIGGISSSRVTPRHHLGAAESSSVREKKGGLGWHRGKIGVMPMTGGPEMASGKSCFKVEDLMAASFPKTLSLSNGTIL